MRLATEFWVMAQVRGCSDRGLPVAVMRKGDPQRGSVVVKVALLDGRCQVFVQTRDVQGTLGWGRPLGPDPVAEADGDGYVARAVGRDPDLWVVEVEHRHGTNPFEGPLVD